MPSPICLLRPASLSVCAVFCAALALAGVTPADATTAATTDLKKEIEGKIVQVQKSAAPKLKVGAATCPAKLAGVQKRVPIGTYACTVQIEGVAAPYSVVVKEGGFLKGGVYSIAPSKAIIDLTKVVGFVRQSLDESEAASAKIVCGKGIVVVLAPNGTIVCTVTVAGSAQNYTFVVKDVNGTIALRTAAAPNTSRKPGAGSPVAPASTPKPRVSGDATPTSVK